MAFHTQTKTLARILFVSQSTHPLGHMSDADIFRSASRQNNSNDISGVILRGEHWFCQVLEGCGRALEQTWQRIRADNRHGAVRHWWVTDAPIRLFTNWRTEHWGISPQVERIFLEMIVSEDIPTADKITLVRAFALVRRASSRAKRSGFEDVGNTRFDHRQLSQPIDPFQKPVGEVITKQR
jgi:hypothetical protein